MCAAENVDAAARIPLGVLDLIDITDALKIYHDDNVHMYTVWHHAVLHGRRGKSDHGVMHAFLPFIVRHLLKV